MCTEFLEYVQKKNSENVWDLMQKMPYGRKYLIKKTKNPQNKLILNNASHKFISKLLSFYEFKFALIGLSNALNIKRVELVAQIALKRHFRS